MSSGFCYISLWFSSDAFSPVTASSLPASHGFLMDNKRRVDSLLLTIKINTFIKSWICQDLLSLKHMAITEQQMDKMILTILCHVQNAFEIKWGKWWWDSFLLSFIHSFIHPRNIYQELLLCLTLLQTLRI